MHFKGVGRGVRERHHPPAELGERPLGHQLHPHGSDAAFDAEGAVDRRVLLETGVQLGVGGRVSGEEGGVGKEKKKDGRAADALPCGAAPPSGSSRLSARGRPDSEGLSRPTSSLQRQGGGV